ncbi:MAG: nitroreductase family protein [Desulfuromonadales bacterium]|nr:nitroreductase family protein [Desulfuromonadales bacterium]
MIELLRKRRSIRKYTEKKVPKETVDTLVEALLRAPSSRDIRPTEFVIVDDPLMLEKLSLTKKHGSSFLKNAALCAIIAADSKKADTWVEDCSIAAILLQITVLSLGLGSCWIQIRGRDHDGNLTAEDYVKKVLNMPENITVECIISVGYAAEELEGVPAEKLGNERVKYGSY